MESADRTAKGAAIGAGVGPVAGKDVRDVAKGGLIGGGAGALTKDDVNKKKTKNYAKHGAAIGGGAGLVTDGVEGMVKGAICGGTSTRRGPTCTTAARAHGTWSSRTRTI